MFEVNVNLLRSLMWQYDGTKSLRSLAEQKQAWYSENIAGFWSDWFRDVFDMRTANSFGLSVWAMVLNLPLAFEIEPSEATPFGFDPYGGNFERSNFGSEVPFAAPLTLEQRRLALRLRFFQLTTDATVPAVNAFLASLFTEGKVYVEDGHDMTCAYVFRFPLDPLLRRVLTDFDLLPRPAGVKVAVLSESDGGAFGFANYGEPFDQGNFPP